MVRLLSIEKKKGGYVTHMNIILTENDMLNK